MIKIFALAGMVIINLTSINAYAVQPTESTAKHAQKIPAAKTNNSPSNVKVNSAILNAARFVQENHEFRKALILDTGKPVSFPEQLKQKYNLSQDELAAICMFAIRLNWYEYAKNGISSFTTLSPDIKTALSYGDAKNQAILKHEIETSLGLDAEFERVLGNANSSQQNVQSGTKPVRDDRIYIDSVPRGATVYLLPKNEGENKDVELGKTPLEIDPKQTPSLRFQIMMNMRNYIKAIEKLPNLDKWIKGFEQSRISTGYNQDYFLFYDATTTQSEIDNQNRKLVAVGPVYDLDYPKQHRLVALFIPRGVKTSAFFSVMPPPDSFMIDPTYFSSQLIREFDISSEKANEAVESLRRCGKYIAITKIPNASDKSQIIVLTVQKGDIAVRSGTIASPPGYSD